MSWSYPELVFKNNFKSNFKVMTWRICHLRADSAVWLSHTSSIWPWSGAPKSTFVWYICKRLTSLAPTNEESAWAQWGKNLYRKKIISHLSACDVTCVVSWVTKNLSVRVKLEWRKVRLFILDCIFTMVACYLDLLQMVLLSGCSFYLFCFCVEPWLFHSYGLT